METDILIELQNQSLQMAANAELLADLQMWIIGGIGFVIGLLTIGLALRSLNHG